MEEPNGLEAALAYAQLLHWPVLPLFHPRENGACTCSAGPTCSKPGKHPNARLVRQGYKNASADEGTIRDWWRRQPLANVGILTGRATGLVVIDVDPRNGGDESLSGLELPPTLEARTGGGGRHLYFAYPEGATIGCPTGVLPGIDVRADGGYIIAPPSRHATGALYSWLDEVDPFTAKLAPLPPVLLPLIETRRHTAKSIGSDVAKIPKGERNATLARFAGAMRRSGMTPEVMIPSLLSLNELCVDEEGNPLPLPEPEILAIARSMGRYEPGDPALRRPEEIKPQIEVICAIDVLDIPTWNAIPDPTWLVRDLIPDEQSLIVVYGMSGSMKSFVTLDLGLAIATKTRFLPPSADTALFGGFEGFEVVEQAPILYLAAEDHDSRLKHRLAQLRSVRGLDGSCGQGYFYIHPVNRGQRGRFPVFLSNDIHRLEIARRVQDEGYRLIVFDTMAECVRDVDENSAKDTGRLTDFANELRAAGASVVLLHHTRKAPTPPPPSKNGGGEQSGQEIDDTEAVWMRGSSALHGAADLLLACKLWKTAGDKAEQLRFRVTKSRVLEKKLWRDLILDVASTPTPELRSMFTYASDFTSLNERRRDLREVNIARAYATALAVYEGGLEVTVKRVQGEMGGDLDTIRTYLEQLADEDPPRLKRAIGLRGPGVKGGRAPTIYIPPASDVVPF